MYSKDDIIAEINKRKSQSSGQSTSSYSKQDIIDEINRRQPSFIDKTKSFVKAIPGEVKGAYGQVTQNPTRALKEAGAGAGEFLQNVAQQAGKGLPQSMAYDYFAKKSGIDPQGYQPTDFNKLFGIQDNQPGDIILRNALPFFAPGAKLEEGAGALEALATRGLEGAGYSASQGGNPLTGGVLGSAIPGGVAAYRGIKSLPSKVLRGTATPEEISANLAAAGSAPIPIGKITKSPLANRTYENTLALIPGSGVSSKQRAVADNFQNATNDFMENLRRKSGSSFDANDELKNALNGAELKARNIKNDLYRNTSNIAEAEGHKLDLSSFKDKAQEAQDLITNSPLLQADSKIKSFFNTVGGYTSAVPEKDAKPIIINSRGDISLTPKTPTITEANLVKNELWRQGHSLTRSPSAIERGIGSKYKELSMSIGDDIKNSINKTGSEELKSSYNDATNYYKNTYGKFLDKGIYKYLDESKPADALAREIIKPSKLNDRHSDIEKIQSLLPSDKKDLLGYAYLQNSTDKEGNIDARKVASLSTSLGPRQFNSLFSPETRQDILKLTNLKDMSNDALNYMANPKTGHSTLKSWSNITSGGFGALGASAALGMPHALAAGLGAGSIVGGSRLLSNVMTNPAIRTKIVNQILERSKGAKKYDPNLLSKTISRYAPRAQTLSNEKENK